MLSRHAETEREKTQLTWRTVCFVAGDLENGAPLETRPSGHARCGLHSPTSFPRPRRRRKDARMALPLGRVIRTRHLVSIVSEIKEFTAICTCN
jgi:hypothetical protein